MGGGGARVEGPGFLSPHLEGQGCPSTKRVWIGDITSCISHLGFWLRGVQKV